MKTRTIRLIILILMAIGLSGGLHSTWVTQVDAAVVFSNRPWTNAGAACVGLNGTNLTGTRLTLPAGDDYVVNSVTVNILEAVEGATAQLTLHDDAFGTDQPGNVIATLGTQTLGAPSSFLEYTFPGGGNVLAAGSTYWIGLTVLDANPCAAGWDAADSAPTGIFTFSNTRQFWMGNWQDPVLGQYVDIEIDATVVPGPPPDHAGEPGPPPHAQNDEQGPPDHASEPGPPPHAQGVGPPPHAQNDEQGPPDHAGVPGPPPHAQNDEPGPPDHSNAGGRNH
jgi:hypothetical protein